MDITKHQAAAVCSQQRRQAIPEGALHWIDKCVNYHSDPGLPFFGLICIKNAYGKSTETICFIDFALKSLSKNTS
jgi:hypothetical protein